MKKPLNIVVRPEDYRYGDGHIKEKLTGLTTANWGSHFEFQVWQLLANGDSDDCWDFGGIKGVDAFMDALIANNVLPPAVVQQITDWGFMDTGIDGKPHFHSSPRYPGIMTGIGQNGAQANTELDFAKKNGLVPFTMLPVTQDMTVAEYFDKTAVTGAMISIAQDFLALMGGKNFILYQWIVDGGPTNVTKMAAAQSAGPYSLGIATNDGWNQVHPEIATGAPNHVVSGYAVDLPTLSVNISDNYAPFLKVLDRGYQISYVLQIIVQYIPPPPLPPAPTQPVNPALPVSVSAWQKFFSLLSNWLEALSPQGRAKLGGASRSSQWPAFKTEYAKTHLPVCAVCGGTADLNLHHLKPFHVFPQLELDPTNVLWLCNAKQCHIRIGHLGNFQSINPAGKEDISIWRDKMRARPMTPADIKADFPNK